MDTPECEIREDGKGKPGVKLNYTRLLTSVDLGNGQSFCSRKYE